MLHVFTVHTYIYITIIFLENRMLDALSVFLSVPLPKKSIEFDDNPHVSIFINIKHFQSDCIFSLLLKCYYFFNELFY